jgi:FAD-dependent urate hydroxylase
VIAGTGYFGDPTARPEIAGFADQIMLWRDRYNPPDDEQDPFLGNHPYLGEGHEYLEKTPGQAPYLRDIHAHNPAGFVSFGLPIGDVPSMRRDIPLVAARISRDFFLADQDKHEQRIIGTIAADFPGEAYASAVWQVPG